MIKEARQFEHIKKKQTETDGKYVQASNLIWKQYQDKHNDKNQSNDQCVFSPEIDHYHLHILEKQLQLVILHYKIIPSTMILSDQWPREYLDNNIVFCFIADQQTKGVGQKSNKWLSPFGNIYLSLLLQTSLDKMKGISIMTSNAIVMTINQYTSIRARCKWVNDVILQNKKVAGVLIKNQIFAGMLQKKGYTQIGVGINIKQPPSQEFACVQSFAKSQINLQQFLLIFLKILFAKIFDSGSLFLNLMNYEQSLLYLKQNVVIYDETLSTTLLKGIFQGVNDCGHALIKTADGIKIAADGRMRKIEKGETSKKIDIKSIMSEL